MKKSLVALSFLVLSSASALAKVDHEDLAQYLQPNPASTGGSETPVNSKERLEKIFEILNVIDESTDQTPVVALETAYEEIDQIPEALKIDLRLNIVRQYQKAYLMGLFRQVGKYNSTITRGRDKGKNVVFEHIVPAKIVPEFSDSLSNLRVVVPSDKRTDPLPTSISQLDTRSAALAERFKAFLNDRNTPEAVAIATNNALATDKLAVAPQVRPVIAVVEAEQAETSPQVKEQRQPSSARAAVSAPQKQDREDTPTNPHDQEWSKMMAANPSAETAPPRITIDAKNIDSKSFTTYIVNKSSLPSEVIAETSMLKRDQRSRGKMDSVKQILRLLPGERREMTSSLSSGNLLGWIVVVKQRGEIVEADASEDWLFKEFAIDHSPGWLNRPTGS